MPAIGTVIALCVGALIHFIVAALMLTISLRRDAMSSDKKIAIFLCILSVVSAAGFGLGAYEFAKAADLLKGAL